ncbi:hypothetical protein [Streptomyces sp. NPDC057199]|uniref:hypothetical protein n=1 Tax=Streptomyces sp. NPDC057199 TaxID=3346047 RepID=UPI0036276E0C
MTSSNPNPAPIRLLRTEDLLDLRFSFLGLRLDDPLLGRRTLLRADPAVEGWVVVEFGPQHVTEQAFFESAGPGLPAAGEPGASEPHPAPPVPARIGGRSVLVFVVGEQDRIDYTPAGLLGAMRTLPLRVVDAARAPVTPAVTARLAEAVADHRAEHVLRAVRTLAQLTARYDAETALSAVLGTRPPATHPPTIAAPEPAPEPGTERGPSREPRTEPVQQPRPDPRQEPGQVQDLQPKPGPENPLADPTNPRSGIELPYRLLLSPTQDARWTHTVALDPPQPQERIALWHTGLRQETARVVWTRDPDFVPDRVSLPPPRQYEFRMPLDSRDRHQLVHLTSNFALTGDRPPEPVDVRNLTLSSLGGGLDSIGRWPTPPEDLDVTQWRHRAALGRDHYVRVMYAGRLCPFGHRAELVKVTERKFDHARPDRGAYLSQRMFIVVREPVINYDREVYGPGAPPRDQLHLLFPFTSVQLLTSVTPDLAEPANLDGILPSEYAFFAVPYGKDPTNAEDAFRFSVSAVDRDGTLIEFQVPLLFLGKTAHHSPAHVTTVVNQYNAQDSRPTSGPPDQTAPIGRVTATLRGQSMALAPSKTPGDTALDVADAVWGMETTEELLAEDSEAAPRFVPRLRWARGVLPQVSNLSGFRSAVPLRYPPPFVKHGFGDGNQGELFVELLDSAPMAFHHSGEKSGALVTPSFSVAGVSRLTGPVAAPPLPRPPGVSAVEVVGYDWSAIAGGGFDPTAFFGDNAKLFGVIPLVELLKATGLDNLQAPNFFAETVDAVTGFLGDLRRVRGLTASLEQLFPEIATLVIRTTDSAAIFAETLTAFIVGRLKDDVEAPGLDDVENAFRAFETALTLLRDNLPAATDAGVRAVLERVQQQVATWQDTVGGALALKDAIQLAAKGAKLADVVNARMEWAPDLSDWPAPPKDPVFHLPDGAAGHLTLVVDRRGALREGVPQGADVTCTLSNFDLILVPGVLRGLELHFDRIRFTMRIGKKPDIEVKFGRVRFVKELSFVETLRELIPLDGFSDPPAIEVTSSGITANYSMPLPSAAVGVFSLENIALSASLQVPFIGGTLEVGFAFCRREAPFRLTVSMLGGGGYFGIVLSAEKIKVLEAALEFGAAVSLNFGVASGSLSVMAGVYFRLDIECGVKLVGYLRARGEVDVLGLVSASIELYLEIGYSGGYAVGRATLTISIEIGFFSESVEITCEKRFAGSGAAPAPLAATAGLAAADPPPISPPTFADLMAGYPDPVTGEERDPVFEYCTAFAGVTR